MLVALLIDPFKYEVKPVGGPGSPGVLFVEGQKFNVNRFYAPPVAPTITPQPGDIVSYDQYGMPVIVRPVSSSVELGPKIGIPGSKTLVQQREAVRTEYAQISQTELMIEAQRSAVAA